MLSAALSPSTRDQQPQSTFIEVQTPKDSHGGIGAGQPEATIAWSHIDLRVTVKNPKTKKKEEKVILSDVSGVAHPGEMLVLMGPSGAGKSSLIDCISGRNKGVTGTVTINGMPWTKKNARMSAYVQQNDLFYETLTVREHLLFHAKLRMGRHYSKETYTQRVDTVIEELGLTKCRDTLIGGPSLRGISGGESKRLSFASEILTNPSVLFVDEPTSGLDSHMAETVVKQLQQLARDGRTIITTIHQPSSELYTLFDRLYLLADGATIYHGKASDAVGYFGQLGYPCPSYTNPSDYFMRLLAADHDEADKAEEPPLEKLKRAWQTNGDAAYGSGQALAETQSTSSNASEEVVEDTRLGIVEEMSVLARRNVLRLVRDRMAFRVNIFQAIYLSVIIGLIYLQLDIDQKGIQNIVGGLFFAVTNITFMASNSTMMSVPLELGIITREYKSNVYRAFSWYLAKNVSQLPMEIIVPIVYFTPLYFLMGLGHGFETWLLLQLILIAQNSTGVALGLMISCIVRRADIVMIVGIMLNMPFMVFGGLLINVDDSPDYFAWIEYVSPIKYAFEAVMTIFWSKVDTIPCDEQLENCSARSGDDVLANYSLDERSVFTSAMILLALNLAFRVVGFVGLMVGLKRSK